MIYSKKQLRSLENFPIDIWLNCFSFNERIFIDYLLEKNQFTCNFLCMNRNYFDFKIYSPTSSSSHYFQNECFQWSSMLFLWNIIPPRKEVKIEVKIDKDLTDKEKLFVYIFPEFARYHFNLSREYNCPSLYMPIINFLKEDIEDVYETIFKDLLNTYNISIDKEFFLKHQLNDEKHLIIEQYPTLWKKNELNSINNKKRAPKRSIKPMKKE